MGEQNEPDPTPPDDDDDFPWDAPIVVVRSTPPLDEHGLLPEGYMVMPAGWAADQRLTFGARGLLAEVQARGGSWEATPEEMAQLGAKEDVAAIRGYVAELEREGYFGPEE